MANKMTSGKWFYIVGAALIGIAILENLGSSDSSQSQKELTRSPTRRLAPPAYRSPPVQVSTPQSVKNDFPLTLAASTPATQSQTPRPVVPPPRSSTPVRTNPSPPSKNFVPEEVALTAPVTFPEFSGGVQTGLISIPAGTNVKLIRTEGRKVVVEYKGNRKTISASSTNMLELMRGTVN